MKAALPLLAARLHKGRFSKKAKDSVLMELTFWSQDGRRHTVSFPKYHSLPCFLGVSCSRSAPPSSP